MIKLSSSSGKDVLVFKHLEQIYLRNLSKDEIWRLKDKFICALYFGGPSHCETGWIDFIIGRKKNVLNASELNIPILELTGADFVQKSNLSRLNVVSLVNASRHKRHEHFILAAKNAPNINFNLYVYSSFIGLLKFYWRIRQLESISANVNIFFGIQGIFERLFPWNSSVIEKNILGNQVFILNSKVEGVNRATVLASKLGCEIIMAGDCKGDTHDYLIEQGVQVDTYSNLDELTQLIKKRALSTDTLSAIDQNYGIWKLYDWILTEFNTTISVSIFNQDDPEKIIASHSKTRRSRGGKDDMASSIYDIINFVEGKYLFKSFIRDVKIKFLIFAKSVYALYRSF